MTRLYLQCAECQMTFIPRQVNQKYCHHKCYRKAADRRRRGFPMSDNWVEVQPATETAPTQAELKLDNPIEASKHIEVTKKENSSQAITGIYGADLNRPTKGIVPVPDKKDQANDKE